MKVWAVAAVRSKVTDSTIAESLIELFLQAVEEYTILTGLVGAGIDERDERRVNDVAMPQVRAESRGVGIVYSIVITMRLY